MQVNAKGNTIQEKMKSLKDVRGYDPILDNKIERMFKNSEEDFWINTCEMNKYNSWGKWASDYDYPLQFLSDNPYYSVSRQSVQNVFYRLNNNSKKESIDYSRAGLSPVKPVTGGNFEKQYNNDIDSTKGAFVVALIVVGVLVSIALFS